MKCPDNSYRMKGLQDIRCSWCLKSIKGVALGRMVTRTRPFSERLKAKATVSLSGYMIDLGERKASTVILNAGDLETAQWELCSQICTDALERALAEELDL